MTTMLEKAARAAWIERGHNPDEMLMCNPPRPAYTQLIPTVRAVLLAVREADDRMLRAAFAEMNRTPGRQWKAMKAANKTPREIFDAKERPRFTAMIDAILNESAE